MIGPHYLHRQIPNAIMQSNDLLYDFEKTPVVKSKLYRPLVWIFFIFLLALAFYYYSNIALAREEGILLEAISIGIYVIGTLFFLYKKAAGWFLNSLFFFFWAEATILSSIREIIDETIRFIPIAFLMLLLEILACILLLAPSIRKQLKVSSSLLTIAISIPTGLNLLFGYFLFFKKY